MQEHDLVMCLVDFNGHVGKHIDGFYGVHGGCFHRSVTFGTKNVIRVLSEEGIMCVEYMIVERGKEEGDFQNG